MPPGLLLDTHMLHWWWCSPALLSRRVRDWIDRLLVAQAQQENLQLISLDPALEALGEPLLW